MYIEDLCYLINEETIKMLKLIQREQEECLHMRKAKINLLIDAKLVNI